MPLRKPKPTGTTSASADALQHEVALRVQKRIDADAKKKRRIEFKKSVAKWFEIFFLLAIVSGICFAYQSGIAKKWLSGEVEIAPSSAESPQGVVAPPPVEVAEVEVNAKELVEKAERNFNAQRDSERAFAGATVEFWKNAAAQDKPVKGGAPISFVGIVPGAGGAPSLLNLSLGGKSGLSATMVAVGAKPIEVSRAEFDKMTATTPYLVAREGRAYVCSSGKRKLGSGKLPVPAKGESFNPSRADLGPLCDEIVRLKTQTPSFRYKVTLDLKNFSRRIDLGVVGFGEEIDRAAFVSAVRKIVDDAEACETLLSAAVVEYAVEFGSPRR